MAHETLQLQARADLILRRFEYDQGVDEKPATEWRKGELVPDDLGQENSEVEAVPAREENVAYWVANDTTIHACAHTSPIPRTHCAPPREGQEARLACGVVLAAHVRYQCRPGRSRSKYVR